MPALEILVVDDDPQICEGIRIKLEQQGHLVTCADNGARAIEQVQQRGFDVVVTDILMPVFDGLQVIEEVRRAHPDTRVVAISGGGRAPYQYYLDAAISLGAHAVLAKPFSFSELNDVVESITGNR